MVTGHEIIKSEYFTLEAQNGLLHLPLTIEIPSSLFSAVKQSMIA